jgi:hypothetical protein
MPRRTKCSDPFHDTRSAQPGFQEFTGIRADRAGTLDDPPIIQDGILCGACAAVHDAPILADLTQKKAQFDSMITKLTNLGFTQDEISLMNLTYDVKAPAITPSAAATASAETSLKPV